MVQMSQMTFISAGQFNDTTFFISSEHNFQGSSKSPGPSNYAFIWNYTGAVTIWANLHERNVQRQNMTHSHTIKEPGNIQKEELE